MGVVLFTLPLLGEITLGTALGVVGTIAQFLLAPKPKEPTIKAMTSAWGDSWPIVYNSFRVAGKVIQAGDVQKHTQKSKKGGPTYSQTFACGVCEGVTSIGRIWADNQIIYDPRPLGDPPTRLANTLYGVGDMVMAPGNTDYYFIASQNGETGSGSPSWNFSVDAATRDGDVVWLAARYHPRTKVGQQFNFTFRVYQGDEDQLPDSALEEMVGSGNQPAYRGLCYVVFEDFNLSKFGNRIPNMEFEVLGQQKSGFTAGAVLYGHAGSSANSLNANSFLVDDIGGIYYTPSNNDTSGGSVGPYNIKTLASTGINNTRVTADAASFGSDQTGGKAISLGGKYFIIFSGHVNLGPYAAGAVLYEMNSDGTATCLGAKKYLTSFSGSTFDTDVMGGTIMPGSGEVVIAYGDFSTESPNCIVLDSIQDMMGACVTRPFASRIVHISEIGGSGAIQNPFLTGYSLAFVGASLYVFLNKAHMDYLVANPPPGVGRNSYYYSLQPAHPNGVAIRIDLTALAGNLSYTFVGPVTDFGWPFSDEGKKKSGAAGQTTAATYDDWGPPVQSQDPLTGAVSRVIFSRGYSDAANEVGFKSFVNGALEFEQQGVPFDGSWSSSINTPFVTDINNALYLVFRNGPIYYAKLGTYVSTELTLEDICADVSTRVGLDTGQMDYTGLASVVPRGCALLTRDLARNFLESLQPAFFYDLTDIGPRIEGTLRSNDVIIQTIPEADLAAVPASSDGSSGEKIVDRISNRRTMDIELPQDLSVAYYDVNHDYQKNAQQYRRTRVTQYSSGANTVSCPVVMNAGEANNAAARGLFLLWVERTPRKFTVPIEYVARTPVDVVLLQRDGINYAVRLTKMTFQPGYYIEGEGISEDLGTYSIQVPMPVAALTNDGQGPATINPVTTPVLAVLDVPPLRSDDVQTIGVYNAAANSDGGQYDTVAGQESQDNSIWNTVASLPLEATMGLVALALPDCPRYTVWDRVNTITVTMYYGSLGSASEADVIDNLANLCWMGNGELIQFATATFMGTDVDGKDIYELSNLLRGRFGTEQLCGTHSTNEKFLFLDQNAMQTVTYDASDIGATRYWRGLNDAAVNPSSVAETLVMVTRRLMPPAPTFIRGSRDISGNLTITGLRRMRYRGRPLWTPPETDTPVTVEVDIMNGVAVVRTLTTTLSVNGSGITDASAFTAYYAVADQILDFGSPQASVSVRAYSVNAIVGRGYGGVEAA